MPRNVEITDFKWNRIVIEREAVTTSEGAASTSTIVTIDGERVAASGERLGRRQHRVAATGTLGTNVNNVINSLVATARSIEGI